MTGCSAQDYRAPSLNNKDPLLTHLAIISEEPDFVSQVNRKRRYAVMERLSLLQSEVCVSAA